MPQPNENIFQFKNYNHSPKVPFVVHAEFECMLQKIQTGQPCDKSAYTKPYQKHLPNNFAYYIKYCNGDLKPPVEYSGIDVARVFYEKIKQDAVHTATEYYDKVVPMNSLNEYEML